MTKIAWLVGAASFGLVWVCASACVGDDPSISTPDASGGPLPGELRGPCNKGTCLTGLVCDPKLDQCVRADDGGAPTDGSAGDAATDAAADAPVPTCPPVFDGGMNQVSCENSSGGSSSSSGGSSGGGPPATGACTKPSVCCLESTSNTCASSEANCAQVAGKILACGGDESCTGTQVCCLELQVGFVLDAGACPSPISASEVKGVTCVDTACGVGMVRVCRKAAECDAGKECRRLKVQTSFGASEIGVCL